MSPADKILRKALVASSLDSSQWERIRASLRDRAFFSAQITSAKFLADSRAAVANVLAETQTSGGTIYNREDAIRAIRESAERNGLMPTGTSAMTDPRSRTRAAIIVDTNAGLAAGYARHEQNMTLGSRIAFPAQEFLRVRQSASPRPDWPERWRRAGGKRYDGTRMIAPVDSPVWSKLSRFGLPYPPFDYNSGMGTRLVSRDEAVSLGVIKPDEMPSETPSQPGFNDTLNDEIDIGHWTTGEFENLRETFGDQVQFTQSPSGIITATWQALKIRSAFENPTPGNGSIATMGKATSALMNRLPPALAAAVDGKSCSITRELIRHMEKDGHWPKETHLKLNHQLAPEELDLIPHVWRSPDRAIPSRSNTAILELDALSGGAYCLVVDTYNSPKILTFYKRK